MYKNWKEIHKIQDAHFMWALALLDLATDFGRMIVERFPEFFTAEQPAKPLLSELRAIAGNNFAAEWKRAKGETCLAPSCEYLVSCDAIPEWMPIMHFVRRHGDDCLINCYPDALSAPPELENEIDYVGSIYTWQGKKLILVEFSDWEWYFVPAELIAIDSELTVAK